jgi:ABC-type transport system substrate-binding protein
MLAVIVLSATIVHTSDAGNARALEKGPRTEDLHISFYPNITAVYTALKEGEIDMLGYELPRGLYDDAVADPDIVLAPVSDFGMYEFDLNNNDTIHSVRGYKNPMSYVEMRRAIAFLTDKNHIVEEICGGFAERIDAQVAAPNKGWANKSYWYPHHPYEYDPAQAAATLDTTFPQGTTPNPDYDPAFPGSARYLRTYPGGHEKAGQDLDALKFVIRNDDIRRLMAGRLIAGNAKKLGIPVDSIEGPSAALYDRVMGDRNYHLYTGGWSATRFPGKDLYGVYHSHCIYSYGPNYVTGIRENEPRYPRLDEYLERARFPAKLR